MASMQNNPLRLHQEHAGYCNVVVSSDPWLARLTWLWRWVGRQGPLTRRARAGRAGSCQTAGGREAVGRAEMKAGAKAGAGRGWG